MVFNASFSYASSCEKEQRESILASLTRSNLQILTNALFTLPTTDSDVGPLAALPRPSTALPREKRLPKTGEDAMTRWEKFAKAKGIHKRKRSAMEWDENSGEWIPRHGGRTRQNRRDDLGDWCEEVKEEEPKAKEKRKK